MHNKAASIVNITFVRSSNDEAERTFSMTFRSSPSKNLEHRHQLISATWLPICDSSTLTPGAGARCADTSWPRASSTTRMSGSATRSGMTSKPVSPLFSTRFILATDVCIQRLHLDSCPSWKLMVSSLTSRWPSPGSWPESLDWMVRPIWRRLRLTKLLATSTMFPPVRLTG